MAGARSAEAVVTAFCDVWASGDVEQILRFVAPDVEVCFGASDPFTGRDLLAQTLQGTLNGVDGIRFEIRALATAAGGRVLVERVDVITGRSGEGRLPVMAAFDVRAGAISQWCDYYDQEQFVVALTSVGGPTRR